MKKDFFNGRFTARTNSDAKRIIVTGPDNFELDMSIDYDDVNHDTVDQNVMWLLKALNNEWPETVRVTHNH